MIGNHSLQKEYLLISEAYNKICEDTEGRNINKAEKYISKHHPEILNGKLRDGRIVTPRIVTQELRNMMPNSRLSKCKFLEGVARIYLDEMMGSRNSQKMVSMMNQYLKVLTDKNHVDRFDTNLSGMSYGDIEKICESVIKANLEKDRNELSIRRFERRNDLEIIKIRSFKEANGFSDYTDWCICRDRDMYERYTGGNSGMFYFVLSRDFKTEKRIAGENCPYDEYGLSMVAVCVNGDGTLNTCTTRWNHENGGTDYDMSTSEISDFVGGNFYELFKPRGIEEQWAERIDNMVNDDAISKKLGAIKTQVNGKNTKYVIRKGNSIVELSVVKRLDDGRICLAGDMFYWFDGNGNRIIPPREIEGDLVIHNIDSLKSLRGMPRKIKGMLVLSELDGITDLKGIAEEIEGVLQILYCGNLNSTKHFPLKYKYLNIKGCPFLLSDVA